MSTSAPSHTVKRSDIEGLRALSVTAVLFHHAHVPGFSGGFVGVDVFFVISGFLITRLLLAELELTGGIDLARFWKRRAVRLLPNASLTLIAVLLAGLVAMPLYEHAALVGDVFSAAFYWSNVHFLYQAVDYFHVGEESRVLNFWSLSVEEQFYLVWPVLLVIAARVLKPLRPSTIVGLLVLGWGLAFAASIVLVYHDQTRAFFNSVTRSWELATGALVAALLPRIERLSPTGRTLLAWIGLASIVASIVLLHPRLLLPGFWVLLPTLGCAAIIAAGDRVSALPRLSVLADNRPILWLGARSYSLYLWHWPVLLFARDALGEGPLATAFAVAASVAVAELAYRFVEDPLRRGLADPDRGRRSLRLTLASVAAMTVLAGALLAIPTVFRSHPAAALAIELNRATADVNATLDRDCLVRRGPDIRLCRHGDTAATRRVVLVGDSHAAMWFGGLEAAARSSGWALETHTKVFCPVADVARESRDLDCTKWREAVVARVIDPATRPDLVVIAGLDDYSGVLFDPASGRVLDPDGAAGAWTDGLERLLRRLREAGVAVAAVNDIPKTRRDYRSCLAKSRAEHPDLRACDRPRVEALRSPTPVMRATAAVPGAILVDLNDEICDDRCRLVRDGRMVYRDDNHVTDEFSRRQAPHFAALLAGVPRP
ncbi:MAG: acyltransferase family protein [Siculibacillus sp.]